MSRGFPRFVAITLQEGLQKGRSEKALETAENLIRMNVLTTEQIAQATNLSFEKVQEIQKIIAEGNK